MTALICLLVTKGRAVIGAGAGLIIIASLPRRKEDPSSAAVTT